MDCDVQTGKMSDVEKALNGADEDDPKDDSLKLLGVVQVTETEGNQESEKDNRVKEITPLTFPNNHTAVKSQQSNGVDAKKKKRPLTKEVG